MQRAGEVPFDTVAHVAFLRGVGTMHSSTETEVGRAPVAPRVSAGLLGEVSAAVKAANLPKIWNVPNLINYNVLRESGVSNPLTRIVRTGDATLQDFI